MALIDTILLIILGGFVLYGFFFGLIRTAGNLLGLIAGFIAASAYYETIFSWIDKIFLSYQNIGRFLVFVLLFTLINRFIGLLFSWLGRLFDILSIIPFLKIINRLSGAVLGLVFGITVLGLGLSLAADLWPAWFAPVQGGSQIVSYFVTGAGVILFFLPGLWQKVALWAKSFAI